MIITAIHQQHIIPENYSNSNAIWYQRRKAVVIGDSDLNRINKSTFKNDDVAHAIYFKWFNGSNTKQLDYYANLILFDEQPNTVIVHITSDNINNFNYSKVDVEDVAQRIIDAGKKCNSYGVNDIVVSSILVRKKHEVDMKW